MGASQTSNPEELEAKIEYLFTYHPADEKQRANYDAIRKAARALALVITENTPKGPDQSAAIRKLREAVMTANAAVALKGISF